MQFVLKCKLLFFLPFYPKILIKIELEQRSLRGGRELMCSHLRTSLGGSRFIGAKREGIVPR